MWGLETKSQTTCHDHGHGQLRIASLIRLEFLLSIFYLWNFGTALRLDIVDKVQ